MRAPSEAEINKTIETGDFDIVDNLFYPGEKARFNELKSKYPKPEGSGRPFWPDVERRKVFNHSDRRLGVWNRQDIFADGIYIGTIDHCRKGVMNTVFKTHDGKEFAHWGGEGAYTYILDRYWRHGDPPDRLIDSIKGLFSKKTK